MNPTPPDPAPIPAPTLAQRERAIRLAQQRAMNRMEADPEGVSADLIRLECEYGLHGLLPPVVGLLATDGLAALANPDVADAVALVDRLSKVGERTARVKVMLAAAAGGGAASENPGS